MNQREPVFHITFEGSKVFPGPTIADEGDFMFIHNNEIGSDWIQFEPLDYAFDAAFPESEVRR